VSRTSEEIRAQFRAEKRSASPNASPGARFRASDLGRRLASGKGLDGGHHRVEVSEDPWAFRDYLRTRAFDMSALELMTDAERIVEVRPTPVSLLPLVTIVPTSTVQIPTIPESLQVEDASYTPDAQNLPGLGPDVDGSNVAEWSVVYLEAVRVGRIIPVPLTILQDAGQAEATIDRLISQNWARAIEGYLVAGNVTNLVGIINTVGVSGLTVGSPLSEFDSLGAGVAAVQSGGFYGPHVVAASARTLEKLFTLRDNFANYLRRDLALPTVAAYVPTPGLPDGTAIVCDPRELILYLMGSFDILLSQGFSDFLTRNLVAVRGEQRAAIWVRNPEAFVTVDGI